MSSTRLIILDWDGTLLDTAQRIITSMQKAAIAVGLESPSDHAVQQMIGLELAEAIRRIFPNIEPTLVANIHKLYSQFYIASDIGIPVFPGVEATLKALQDHGYLLAVATGKTRNGLNRHLDELQWHPFFETTRCADEAPSKPNPKMLIDICEFLGVAFNDAMMVGDTTYDLEMAYSIGMPSIGVLYGAHSRAQLEKFKPKALINKFSDLLELDNLKAP